MTRILKNGMHRLSVHCVRRAQHVGQYILFTNFGKKKLSTEISYSPVKLKDNRAEVDKILFNLAILYKNLHMVLGSGGSDQRGWKPEFFLIFSSPVVFPHRMAYV